MRTNKLFYLGYLLTLISFSPVALAAEAEKTISYWQKIETPAHIRAAEEASENKAWVASAKGLYQFSFANKNFTPIESSIGNRFSGVVQTKKGELFAMDDEEGLKHSLDGGKSWHLTLEEAYDPIHVKFLKIDGTKAVAASLEDQSGDGQPDQTELYMTDELLDGRSWRHVNTIPMPILGMDIVEGGHKILLLFATGPQLSTDSGLNFRLHDIANRKPNTMTNRANDFGIGSGKKLWVLENDVFSVDWATTLTNPTKQAVYTTPIQHFFKANQRGEAFLIEKANPDAIAVVDLSKTPPVSWSCDKESGCPADLSEVDAIISNANHSIHWISTKDGFYEIGEKRSHRLKLTIEGAGEVTFYNRATGAVQPFSQSISLERTQFASDFDQISLVARPKNSQWRFKGWIGAPSNKVNGPQCDVEVTSDLEITAKFEKIN